MVVGVKKKLLQIIGITGTLAGTAVFIHEPSWPTPDKLVIFLAFVFMIFSQAVAMLKRLLPFVVLLLVYESFRGLAPHLNSHVNYTFMPFSDQLLFGGLPTSYLQDWLWQGSVMWYDFVFYLAYMMHFILPVTLAIVVWKLKESYYWRYVTAYLTVSFAGFITFVVFPAAPPWLASELGYIPHIVRISSDVWASLGLHDFPSFYNHISPNSVAAVPSLHAAYATLLVIFVWKLFSRKLAVLAVLYPILIYVGTIYQGEHYAIDIIAGFFYALFAYRVAPTILRGVSRIVAKSEHSSNTKTALKSRR